MTETVALVCVGLYFQMLSLLLRLSCSQCFNHEGQQTKLVFSMRSVGKGTVWVFCRATDRKSLTCLHFGHHVIALIWNLDPLAANTLYNDSLAGKKKVIQAKQQSKIVYLPWLPLKFAKAKLCLSTALHCLVIQLYLIPKCNCHLCCS